tara:strand:+ start:2100 stop:2315 length:216 start_codon:yes stop_codon:yes gene_type:complete
MYGSPGLFRHQRSSRSSKAHDPEGFVATYDDGDFISDDARDLPVNQQLADFYTPGEPIGFDAVSRLDRPQA